MHIKLMVAALAMMVASVFGDLPVHDPWFDMLIFYLIFKIITGGMPEPTDKSSDGYVWAYRSFHMLALIPTRYFANKSFWHAFEDKGERLNPR